MSVGEVCNRAVVVTGPRTGVVEAARLMREFHVGDLVVVEPHDGGRVPVGIVTDRDLVVEVLAEEVDPAAVTVADVMSSDLMVAREPDDLLDTVKRMAQRGVRRVPVVGQDGHLVGLLAADDVLDLVLEQVSGLVHVTRREQRVEAERRP
jgi:signal-transduction protein with cAMP-binding, CBS, and nucleotidyltransferase domain